MEKLEMILSYVSTILILIITIITYVIKLIERNKEIQKMEKEKQLETELERLMVQVEELIVDGKTKETFVLDRIKSFGEANDIKVDIDQIKKRINEMIEITKNINKRGG